MADSRTDKIAKIRNLAERGATEGERAAAREALRRMDAAPEREPEEIASELPEWAIQGLGNIFGNITVVQSKNPNHHGRVWYDVSG